MSSDRMVVFVSQSLPDLKPRVHRAFPTEKCDTARTHKRMLSCLVASLSVPPWKAPHNNWLQTRKSGDICDFSHIRWLFSHKALKNSANIRFEMVCLRLKQNIYICPVNFIRLLSLKSEHIQWKGSSTWFSLPTDSCWCAKMVHPILCNCRQVWQRLMGSDLSICAACIQKPSHIDSASFLQWCKRFIFAASIRCAGRALFFFGGGERDTVMEGLTLASP